jgi:hypothetical protein
MLKTKVLESGYTVTEITVGAMMMIMPRLQGTAEEQQQAQLDMMKVCILKEDGTPIGDEVLGLGISTYLGLAEEVMSVNGLGKGGKV